MLDISGTPWEWHNESNMMQQIPKFEDLCVWILGNNIWSEPKVSLKIKELFQARFDAIAPVAEWVSEESCYKARHASITELLLDMLAYLEIYTTKWQFSIDENKEATDFSKRAQNYLPSVWRKYTRGISALHEQVYEASKNKWKKPPAPSIVWLAKYVQDSIPWILIARDSGTKQ